MRRFVFSFLVIATSLLACGCSSLLRAEATADGKISAGPVVIAGREVAPKYDVVDGIATVVVSSEPPFLTINLDPRASFAASLNPAQEAAINEGRVAIYRTGNRLALGGYPVKAGTSFRQDPCPAAPLPPPPPMPAAPRSAAPCPPPPTLAKAEPAPSPVPVYVGPHCLPKFPDGTFDGANAFVCKVTLAVNGWFNSWLPQCEPTRALKTAPSCK